MADEVVFELEASEIEGGSLALPEGKTLDLGKLAKGSYKTSDPAEIAVLDSLPQAKRAGAKSAKSDDKKGDEG